MSKRETIYLFVYGSVVLLSKIKTIPQIMDLRDGFLGEH